MSGEKWSRVRSALAQIGNEAMQYDADGIDICFLNSRVHKKSIMVSSQVNCFTVGTDLPVKTQSDIIRVFDQVQPEGAPLLYFRIFIFQFQPSQGAHLWVQNCTKSWKE